MLIDIKLRRPGYHLRTGPCAVPYLFQIDPEPAYGLTRRTRREQSWPQQLEAKEW